MPLIKTKVDDDFVASFLKTKYKLPIKFQRILAGEVSQAFSFQLPGKNRIIRFNSKNKQGFLKDDYAIKHFRKYQLPIPQILEMGEISNKYYAISELAPGKTADKLTPEKNKLLIPELFNYLKIIHRIPIPGKGYGDWNPKDQTGKYKSTQTWINSIVNLKKWQQIAKTENYFDYKLITNLAEKYQALGKFALNKRFLLHGDYGFNNMLVENNKITGIIDWAESMYGDFIYDLAWLQFWPENINYFREYQHRFQTDPWLENYQERCQLFMLMIGITSMEIFAESKRPKDYQYCLKRLKAENLL